MRRIDQDSDSIRRLPFGVYLGTLVMLSALAIGLFAHSGVVTDQPAAIIIMAGSLIIVFGYLTGIAEFILGLVVKSVRTVSLVPIAAGSSASTVIVALPVLVCRSSDIDAIRDAVEQHKVRNTNQPLIFALLTDFRDHHERRSEADAPLEAALVAMITELNGSPHGARAPAVLLHREREECRGEGMWIGAERKRGKLQALNRLVLTGDRSAFALVEGEWRALVGLRHVLTLDLDTRLRTNAVRDLLAVAAHPANRPRVAAGADRVVAGYGIVQPRIFTRMSCARPTWYGWLFDDMFGGHHDTIVRHERKPSFQQAAFGETSFFGKGLYDVAAAEAVLADRLPRDAVLSHDIVEGAFARCITVDRVACYEEAMPDYVSSLRRRHRWIRGDWQNLIWLLPNTRDALGRSRANRLSGPSRLRILENARLSLVPVILLALLLGTVALGDAVIGLAALLGHMLLLPTIGAALWLVSRPSYFGARDHLCMWAEGYAKALGRGILNIAFLPTDGMTAAAAIGTALVRLLVTRRRLLEWSPSSVSMFRRDQLADYVRAMWHGPAAGAAVLALDGGASVAASVIAALWIGSPAVAWWAGRPSAALARGVTADPQSSLQRTPARAGLAPQIAAVRLAPAPSPSRAGLAREPNLELSQGEAS